MTRFRSITVFLTILSLIVFAQSPLATAQQLVFEAFPAAALVRGENVRLRLDPVAETEIIDVLQRGDPITITGESVFDGDEEYYPVESDLTGDAGWIGALFIDPRSIAGVSAVVVPLDEVDAPLDDTDTVDAAGNQRQQNREARRQDRQAEPAPAPEPELETTDPADDRAARRAARQADQEATAAAEQPADDQAARRAARQAERAANADGANASADTLTFSGEEPTVTPEFTAPSDVLTVTANYEGERNFTVLAVSPDGTEEILFDERGPFSGETTFETDPASPLILDVDANGPWEVVIEPAS